MTILIDLFIDLVLVSFVAGGIIASIVLIGHALTRKGEGDR